MKLNKTILTILVILVIILIVVGIWFLVKNRVGTKEETSERNINVASLENSNEKKLGTIYYPGAKIAVNLKHEDSNYRIVFKTTDSQNGVAEIYNQDLLNRYKSYDVNKKTISKDESANSEAIVLTCSGVTGKITITIWGRKDGLTQVELVTSDNFK